MRWEWYHIFVVACMSIVGFGLGWIWNQYYVNYVSITSKQVLAIWATYELPWLILGAAGQGMITFLSSDFGQIGLISSSLDISRYQWQVTVYGRIASYQWNIPIIDVSRVWYKNITTLDNRKYDDEFRIAVESSLWYTIQNMSGTLSILDQVYKKPLISITSQLCKEMCWRKRDAISVNPQTIRTAKWFLMAPNADKTAWTIVVADREYTIKARDTQVLYTITARMQFVTPEWIKSQISQNIRVCTDEKSRIDLINSVSVRRQNGNIFATIYGQWWDKWTERYICRVRIVSQQWVLWINFINIIQW